MIDTGKLRRVALRQDISTFYQLAKAFKARGYNCSDSQAQRLWDGTTDPKQSTLDKLCDVLKCEQSDLLENHKRRAR